MFSGGIRCFGEGTSLSFASGRRTRLYRRGFIHDAYFGIPLKVQELFAGLELSPGFPVIPESSMAKIKG